MNQKKQFNPLNHPICFSPPLRIAPSAWYLHVPFAMFLVDLLKPEIFIELGTHYGVSYCAFCQAVSELRLPTRCYAIDTWEGDPQAGHYGPGVYKDLCEHHDPLYSGFSRLIQSTFDKAVNHFEDGSIDLLHIDGYHTYESVKHDWETWQPKLSNKGVVLFHDINVREGDFEVWRLWGELKQKFPYFEMIHGHGLGLLVVGDDKPKEIDMLINTPAEQINVIQSFFWQLGSGVKNSQESKQLQDQLSGHEKLIQTQSGVVDEKEQNVQDLKAKLAEKEQIAQDLKVKLAEKEQIVQGLKVKSAEKEQMVQDLKVKLTEKEQIVQGLKVKFDKEEQIVQELKVKLAETKEVEKDIQSQLLDNEDRLEALAVRDAKKERTIQEMKTQLAEQNNQKNVLQEKILGIKNQLNNNEKTLGQLNSKLLEIYDSTAWKLVRRMWRIRLFLAPKGSLREIWGRKIIRGFRRQRTDKTRKTKEEDFDNNDNRGPDIQLEENEGGYQKVYETLFLTAESERDESYVDYCQNDIKIDELPVKTLAFYLPQFHPIAENDRWWGKGFTEWTNVSKAKPQFVDHYQPHLPGELGYYDLRIPDVQKRQVELAKNYGIYGFCYYYYWFNGKRLLERPLDQFINDEKNDFPFCLCWANENWTRRWDGEENDILIAQTHSDDTDLQFIKDIAPYIRDNRYIHIDGRPLVLVYRANILNHPKEITERWREYANSQGLGNPFLVTAQVFGYREDPEEIGFDAVVEFPPNSLPVTDISGNFDILNSKFNGRIYDYKEISRLMCENTTFDYRLFKTVMPSWDNTPRKPNNSSIIVNASPRLYKDWLISAINYTQKRHPQSERFVFINAWNEWAEGTHLEPDRKYGYAYLQATASALQMAKKQKNNWKILFISHDAHMGGAQLSLLSIMHWLREHTVVELKVLCLDGGKLLPEFINVGDTLLYTDIAHLSEEARSDRLVEFCDGNPDLIYANSAGSGKIYSWLHKIGVPILTHFRELDTSIRRYAADWIEEVWDYSQGYITNSEAVRENLIENYSIDKDICHTAHTFVQLSDIEPYNNYKKQQARQELGLEKDKTLIFGCGIGMPFRKGADLFIDTAQKLLEFGEKEFHLYWIGDFNENEKDDRFGIWSDFLQNLEKQKLDEYVTFLGQKSDPRKYMRSGDIFVLTSREEAIGRVILEAADCGLPVICFDDSGGAPEFVEDDAGFIVSKDNSRAMAEKISFLIQNEDVRNKMGSRAREKVLGEFSEAQIMPKVLSVSRKVAGKSPLVSIIMTNYNHAPYLPQRLESIFNQTYQDFEVFLMDDASTDNSVQILKKYSNRPNVHLVVNEKNNGSPFDLWLKAFSMAEGEIIWIAESDDLSEKDFLKKMLPAFNDPQVQLAYCASNIINEKGEIIGDYKNSEYLKSVSKSRWEQSYCVPTNQEINEAFGIKNTIMNMSSVLFRNINWDNLFEKTLSNFYSAGDTYLLLNLMKDGKIFYDSRLLNYHRRHDTSIVGKILSEGGDVQLNQFLKDFSINKQYIVDNFQLSSKFLEKLENYLIELWETLAPGRPYEDLKQYFPLDEIREQVRRNIREKV